MEGGGGGGEGRLGKWLTLRKKAVNFSSGKAVLDIKLIDHVFFLALGCFREKSEAVNYLYKSVAFRTGSNDVVSPMYSLSLE